jgi:hypothetical protein
MTLYLHFIIKMLYEQYLIYAIHKTDMTETYRLEKLLTEKWKNLMCYLSWDVASSGDVEFFVTKECS